MSINELGEDVVVLVCGCICEAMNISQSSRGIAGADAEEDASERV